MSFSAFQGVYDMVKAVEGFVVTMLQFDKISFLITSILGQMSITLWSMLLYVPISLVRAPCSVIVAVNFDTTEIH